MASVASLGENFQIETDEDFSLDIHWHLQVACQLLANVKNGGVVVGVDIQVPW